MCMLSRTYGNTKTAGQGGWFCVCSQQTEVALCLKGTLYSSLCWGVICQQWRTNLRITLLTVLQHRSDSHSQYFVYGSCKVDLFLYLFFFSKRSYILKCVCLFLEALKLAFLINDNGAGKNLFSVPFLLDHSLIRVCRCHERNMCVRTKKNNVFKPKSLIHKMFQPWAEAYCNSSAEAEIKTRSCRQLHSEPDDFDFCSWWCYQSRKYYLSHLPTIFHTFPLVCGSKATAEVRASRGALFHIYTDSLERRDQPALDQTGLIMLHAK